MKVQELINKISNKTFNLEKSLEVQKYIPIMNKKRFITDVIAECTDDIDNFVSVDRFKMRVYFVMKMLGLYTNLEIDSNFDDMIVQYDMLCEKNILDNIVSCFKDDYDRMYVILEDELNTLLIQNSIDAQVVKIANKINTVIDMAVEKFNDVDLNSILPEGTEIDKLMQIINILK